MAEADALPLRDQARGAARHLLEQREVGLRRVAALGVEAVDDEIGQLLQGLVLFGPVEVFERAEAHEARRQARDDRGGLDGFAHHRIVGAGDRQRARGRDAEAVHRLRGEEFADRRAQHRAPVAHARVGRLARALQLDFPALAVRSDDFAEQQRPAVAEAWHVDTELVAGVDRGERFAAGQRPIAGQSCDDIGVGEALGRQPDQCRGRRQTSRPDRAPAAASARPGCRRRPAGARSGCRSARPIRPAMRHRRRRSLQAGDSTRASNGFSRREFYVGSRAIRGRAAAPLDSARLNS